MEKERKLYLKTFGCQMNDADSGKIKNLLADMNIGTTSDPGDADIVLLNTCSIRWKAEHKVYSALGKFKGIKKSRPDMIIGVGGCVAQQEGEEMFKRVPHLDLVFGTHNIHRLPDMIRGVDAGRGKLSETDFFDEAEPLIYPAAEDDGINAYVNIIRGCDNFCSYCIVPYVRGREVSRLSRDVIEEVAILAGNGVKEITLLGQNVNSYGRSSSDDTDFPGLIRKVAKIDGIERLRFTTSHPKDLSDELIDAFGDLEKLCSHLHLPVQSGSNKVLDLMKRGYSVDSYLSRVEKLRAARPDISITTDIIVGFPGEGDDEFKKTLKLMEEVQYDSSFSFKYSKRPGTAAAKLDDTTPEREKEERLSTLKELQKSHSLMKNRSEEGKVLMTLVEGKSKKGEGMISGRTSGNKIVNFKGPEELISTTVPVKIISGFVNSLGGEYMPTN